MSRGWFQSVHPVVIAVVLAASACSLQSLDELPALQELQQRVGFPLDLEIVEGS